MPVEVERGSVPLQVEDGGGRPEKDLAGGRKTRRERGAQCRGRGDRMSGGRVGRGVGTSEGESRGEARERTRRVEGPKANE